MSVGIRKNNDKNPIVILGFPYRECNKNEMRIHVGSLFRFTYRKDFPSLHPYPISSDAGWGCMLRSAQMIMACALQRHLLGKDWRKSENISILRGSAHYCDILKLFSDYPGAPHIYSIHHLVQCGMRYDKLPGEWFGPSTAALVLRDLTKLHRRKYGGPLEILVTQGDTIYIRDCENLCSIIPKECSSDCEKNPANCSDSISIADYEVTTETNGCCDEQNGNKISNGISCDADASSHSPYIMTSSAHLTPEDKTLNSPDNHTNVRNLADLPLLSNHAETQNLDVNKEKNTEKEKSVQSSTSSSTPHANSTFISNRVVQTSSSSLSKDGDLMGNKNPETVITTNLTMKKETTRTNTMMSSRGSSTQGPPLFDPLFNPPPSYTAPWDCSLVVCIPLRLGISSVSVEYIEV